MKPEGGGTGGVGPPCFESEGFKREQVLEARLLEE